MTQPELPNEIENVADFVDHACRLATEFGRAPWWRGHARADWRLLPSVFRAHFGHNGEVNMALRFMTTSRTRRPDLVAMSEAADWLFVMQHHRLPTRLLDWTQSALVALFFAVWEEPTENGRVFMLDPLGLNLESIGRGTMPLPGHEAVVPIIRGAFFGNDQVKNRIVALSPAEMDLRMTLQHSAFTIHTPNADLINFAVGKRWLQYLTVPASMKSRLREQLGLLGVRRSTLFPDLESLAFDISHANFQPPPASPPEATSDGAA